MDNSRHEADSAVNYNADFNLLRDKIDQYYIEARYTYNTDEKSSILGVIGCLKRVFGKASYEDGRGRSTI
jgi:predicted solute-binding protein